MWYRKTTHSLGTLFALLLITLSATGCEKQLPLPSTKKHSSKKETLSMQVHSTAYTSRLKRKNAKYPVGAWGDALTPSCRSIAVSEDLIKMGLIYRSKVKIEGLDGEYMVLDRMHPKWKKRIDVYMGNDFKKARYWGSRTVTIQWEEPKGDNAR